MKQYEELQEWVAQQETLEQSLEDISNTYIAETQKKIEFWENLLPIVIILAVAWRIHKIRKSFKK